MAPLRPKDPTPIIQQIKTISTTPTTRVSEESQFQYDRLQRSALETSNAYQTYEDELAEYERQKAALQQEKLLKENTVTIRDKADERKYELYKAQAERVKSAADTYNTKVEEYDAIKTSLKNIGYIKGDQFYFQMEKIPDVNVEPVYIMSADQYTKLAGTQTTPEESTNATEDTGIVSALGKAYEENIRNPAAEFVQKYLPEVNLKSYFPDSKYTQSTYVEGIGTVNPAAARDTQIEFIQGSYEGIRYDPVLGAANVVVGLSLPAVGKVAAAAGTAIKSTKIGGTISKTIPGVTENIIDYGGKAIVGVYAADVGYRVATSEQPTAELGKITSTELIPGLIGFGAGTKLATTRSGELPSIKVITDAWSSKNIPSVSSIRRSLSTIDNSGGLLFQAKVKLNPDLLQSAEVRKTLGIATPTGKITDVELSLPDPFPYTNIKPGGIKAFDTFATESVKQLSDESIGVVKTEYSSVFDSIGVIPAPKVKSEIIPSIEQSFAKGTIIETKRTIQGGKITEETRTIAENLPEIEAISPGKKSVSSIDLLDIDLKSPGTSLQKTVLDFDRTEIVRLEDLPYVSSKFRKEFPEADTILIRSTVSPESKLDDISFDIQTEYIKREQPETVLEDFDWTDFFRSERAARYKQEIQFTVETDKRFQNLGKITYSEGGRYDSDFNILRSGENVLERMGIKAYERPEFELETKSVFSRKKSEEISLDLSPVINTKTDLSKRWLTSPQAQKAREAKGQTISDILRFKDKTPGIESDIYEGRSFGEIYSTDIDFGHMVSIERKVAGSDIIERGQFKALDTVDWSKISPTEKAMFTTGYNKEAYWDVLEGIDLSNLKPSERAQFTSGYNREAYWDVLRNADLSNLKPSERAQFTSGYNRETYWDFLKDVDLSNLKPSEKAQFKSGYNREAYWDVLKDVDLTKIGRSKGVKYPTDVDFRRMVQIERDVNELKLNIPSLKRDESVSNLIKAEVPGLLSAPKITQRRPSGTIAGVSGASRGGKTGRITTPASTKAKPPGAGGGFSFGRQPSGSGLGKGVLSARIPGQLGISDSANIVGSTNIPSEISANIIDTTQASTPKSKTGTTEISASIEDFASVDVLGDLPAVSEAQVPAVSQAVDSAVMSVQMQRLTQVKAQGTQAKTRRPPVDIWPREAPKKPRVGKKKKTPKSGKPGQKKSGGFTGYNVINPVIGLEEFFGTGNKKSGKSKQRKSSNSNLDLGDLNLF